MHRLFVHSTPTCVQLKSLIFRVMASTINDHNWKRGRGHCEEDDDWTAPLLNKCYALMRKMVFWV